MAEEKEAKKPMIEMSVWFIAFLILLIISTLFIIKLNGDKSRLENELKLAQEQYSQLEAMHSTMVAATKGVLENFDNMTPVNVKEELRKYVSGETVESAAQTVNTPVTVSGEAAE